jgi:hypothetical protein
MSIFGMIQPSIYIFGLEIQEPVTTLTDLFVASVCYFAYYKLHHLQKKEKSLIYFKYFFLTMGISTTLGGLIGHGFLHYFGFAWKIPGWVTGMCSVALMERGAIMHARHLMKPVIGKIFAIINIIELFVFMFIAFYTLNFSFVEIHASYGLIVVFLFELFIYSRKRDPGSKLILYGVGVSACAAVVHLTKFSLHTWFNYFDLSHMFMTLSAFVFYKGITRIDFREPKTTPSPSS